MRKYDGRVYVEVTDHVARRQDSAEVHTVAGRQAAARDED